ncbi:hypothetical protein HPY32_30260 [Nocardia terpenica]|nr:hypothetical protein [Nocardia terpenica]
MHKEYYRSFDTEDIYPGRGHWIGAVFEMDAPFNARTVRDLLWVWHARHEGLRTTVAGASKPQDRLTRLTCDELDVDIVNERIADAATSAQINDRLTAELELRLSPLVWPHCLIATVEHHDTGNFTLLVGADHSVMDAYSQILIVTELRSLYHALLDGTAVRASDVHASPADYALLERHAGAALTAESPAVALWRELLEVGDGKLPRFQVPTPTDIPPSSCPQINLSRWLLNDTEAAAIEAAVTALGYRLTTAVFAAVTLASNRLSGTVNFRTVMPVASRPDKRWSESIGWFVNMVPMQISLPGDSDLTHALAVTANALHQAKVAWTAPALDILEILNVTEVPRFAISFFDVRRTLDNELTTALRGRVLRADSYSLDEVYFWIARTADGLNISARFPYSHSAAVQRFVEMFTAALREFGAGIPSIKGDGAVSPASARAV